MAISHIVIIGGGFGGLDAARAFAGAPLRVTLLDRHNYHLFQPLLYQVATASLSPGDIASPIRWVLRRQENVQVLLAEARAIDVAARRTDRRRARGRARGDRAAVAERGFSQHPSGVGADHPRRGRPTPAARLSTVSARRGAGVAGAPRRRRQNRFNRRRRRWARCRV